LVRNADKLIKDVHIVLFAVMEVVLPGIVDENLDIINFAENIFYQEALDYVRKNGHKNIIRQCKSGSVLENKKNKAS
jgi:hypothetical protein